MHKPETYKMAINVGITMHDVLSRKQLRQAVRIITAECAPVHRTAKVKAEVP